MDGDESLGVGLLLEGIVVEERDKAGTLFTLPWLNSAIHYRVDVTIM